MTVTATPDQLSSLRKTLLSPSPPTPLAHRFRALFTLRALASDEAVTIISEALQPGVASELLGHELAYVLGQMGRVSALRCLEGVLRDLERHPMVRHEAAEAMGAISSPLSVPILTEFLDDSNVSVRETCTLALAKIKFDHSSPSTSSSAPFGSVDPAPALNPKSMHESPAPCKTEDVEVMRSALMNKEASLFERYRAMFGLRNAVGPEGSEEEPAVKAVLALAEGFQDGSALFRHEIAYIFGQLSHPASVPALLTVLANLQEDEMVRHEAAEALGSIATPAVLESLKKFASEEEKSQVVRESCVVALDMYEYENSGQLHYAVPLDTLGKGTNIDQVPAPVAVA